MALRPPGISEKRFFLTYRNKKCTAQPVGKNTLGNVPCIIAKYLNLENPELFTGHCLRRTSSTLLVEAGATFETLKLHGKWKSTSVAEGYIAESMSSKNKISLMIASSVGEPTDSMSVNENAAGIVPQDISEIPVENEKLIDDHRHENDVENNIRKFQSGSSAFTGSFQNCNFYFGK